MSSIIEKFLAIRWTENRIPGKMEICKECCFDKKYGCSCSPTTANDKRTEENAWKSIGPIKRHGYHNSFRIVRLPQAIRLTNKARAYNWNVAASPFRLGIIFRWLIWIIQRHWGWQLGMSENDPIRSPTWKWHITNAIQHLNLSIQFSSVTLSLLPQSFSFFHHKANCLGAARKQKTHTICGMYGKRSANAMEYVVTYNIRLLFMNE